MNEAVCEVGAGSEVAAEVEVVEAVCAVVPEPVAVAEEPVVVATEVVRPNGALGGVLAIRADGFCCYYCASAIGSLTLNSEALSSDWAPCSSAELEAVRAQILHNLEAWKVDWKRGGVRD